MKAAARARSMGAVAAVASVVSALVMGAACGAPRARLGEAVPSTTVADVGATTTVAPDGGLNTGSTTPPEPTPTAPPDAGADPAADPAAPTTTAPPTEPPTAPPTAAPSTLANPDAYRRAGWVAAENARAGTDAWKITADDPKASIEGFADTTSATFGDTVTLFVASASPSWHAEAYRTGFYGGAGGRKVWQSAEQHTEWQSFVTGDPKTGFVESGWNPSLTVPIDASWPPGAYLVKLVSSGGGAHYVPLTVRDDGSPPAMLVVNAVTTWQAYNEWGACSAYKCPFVKGLDRGSRLSFDRPYAHAYNRGAADFLDHERPLIAYAEELGIDLAYATSVDLDAHPELAAKHRAVITLGHDEYYSAAMRRALLDARDGGGNLAFFGANAVYRQIRLEASTSGRERRVMVNYRSAAADPITATDPKLATVEWHSLGLPPQQLTGMAYQCADVSGDVVLTNTAHWVFDGAGVKDGMVLRSLAGNEIDRVVGDRFTPEKVDVLANLRVSCAGKATTGNMAYYATSSGAGVFSTGTIWWVCGLDAEFCSERANVPVVRAVTGNVLRAFAAGPAGRVHPSTGVRASP